MRETLQVTKPRAASMSAAEGEDVDDIIINPVAILLQPDDLKQEDDGFPLLSMEGEGQPLLQKQEQLLPPQIYRIHSIESSIAIRQLPSQGLSFQLWPAAATLVGLLDRHRADPSSSPLSAALSASSNGLIHRPFHILELGSGTGLVGIAAAAILGAYVTVTDLPHVLSNLQFNAEANKEAMAVHGGSVDVAQLNWGETEHMEAIGRNYDWILGSDVVYHDHLYDPLLHTLRHFLLGGEKKTAFVMAHLRRWKKESAFFKKAKKLFNVEIIHADAPSDGSRVGVVVYLFAKKRSV